MVVQDTWRPPSQVRGQNNGTLIASAGVVLRRPSLSVRLRELGRRRAEANIEDAPRSDDGRALWDVWTGYASGAGFSVHNVFSASCWQFAIAPFAVSADDVQVAASSRHLQNWHCRRVPSPRLQATTTLFECSSNCILLIYSTPSQACTGDVTIDDVIRSIWVLSF